MTYALATPKTETAPTRKPGSGRRIGRANDSFEHDADRVADQIMAGRTAHPAWSLGQISVDAPVQRKCSCGGSGGGECEECKEKKTLQRKETTTEHAGESPAIVEEVLKTPGRPLDRNTRTFFEQRMGHDFGAVRVHTDPTAAASASAVRSHAYTVGSDLVFSAGRYAPGSTYGDHLLAHELAHVVQQTGTSRRTGILPIASSGSGLEREAEGAARHATTASAMRRPSPGLTRNAMRTAALQRYETGEHTRFGETEPLLKAALGPPQLTYKIVLGDHPETVAQKFQISLAELVAANKAELMHWDDLTRKRLQGFRPGQTIAIPPTNNPMLQAAMHTGQIQLVVNGVTFDYGEGISMGDFYETPTDMLNAPVSELQALSVLIKRDKAKGDVTNDEWDKATGGRYMKLATKNATHFSPSDPALATVSGKSTADNKSEWEKHHTTALKSSQQGDKDLALATNAFGDHFLTDAFSAGHLINRKDFTEMFEANLPQNAAGTAFLPASTAFFDNVATQSWAGNVSAQFSLMKTVDCFGLLKPHPPAPCTDMTSVHAPIDDADTLSKLLQAVHRQEPSLLEGAVLKGTHDKLNTSGVKVENAMGDHWDLAGDGTLGAKTLPVGGDTRSLEIGQKAVAQSQLNVIGVFKMSGPLNLPGLFKKVWDFVPRPSAAAGRKQVKDAVTAGTNPTDPGLVASVVKLITDNVVAIIAALVTRGKLMRR